MRNEEQIAIHEAGHAVIGLAYGFPVTFATIEPATFKQREQRRFREAPNIRTLLDIIEAGKDNRLLNARSILDSAYPLLSQMSDKIPLDKQVMDRFIHDAGTLRTRLPVPLRDVVSRAVKELRSYKPSPNVRHTSGHVRLDTTNASVLDRIIVKAAGGCAERHFFLSDISTLDRYDNEDIAAILLALIPEQSGKLLREHLERSLTNESELAVSLNSRFIEELSERLLKERTMDALALADAIDEIGNQLNANLSRVRPAK